MCVNDKLKPYFKRFYQAYFIKIGLWAMVSSFSFVLILLIYSKFKMVTSLDLWLGGVGILGLTLTVAVGLYRRPRKSGFYKEIDALGFENRVATYMEFVHKDNPFNPYLEADLLRLLQDAKYKKISLKPPNKLILATLISGCLVLSAWFIETDISAKSKAIEEDIHQLKTQEEVLLEALKEEIKDVEKLSMLEEKVSDGLEAIKEGLRMEDLQLTEQSLFRMEEAIKNQIGAEGLPEAIQESFDLMEEVALDTGQPRLLASLDTQRQSGVQNGQMNENNGSVQGENGREKPSGNGT